VVLLVLLIFTSESQAAIAAQAKRGKPCYHVWFDRRILLRGFFAI
jgi:hypothetical protein